MFDVSVIGETNDPSATVDCDISTLSIAKFSNCKGLAKARVWKFENFEWRNIVIHW